VSDHRIDDQPPRVLRNAEVVLPDRTALADLVLRGPTIDSLLPPGRGQGVEVHDLGGRRVTPGLIDLHVHGGWGVDFYRDDAERIASVADRFLASGVTSLLLTLHTGPIDEMLDRIANAADACELSPVFAGIHLEGPFLARDRKGALPEEGIHAYDAELLGRIVEAAHGKLRVMTFAPESLPPAALGGLHSLGVGLSIGHTSSDAAAVRQAIAAGARRCTHLCNAMPPIHHRDPGPIVELLLDDRVRVEVIPDGRHLDDRVLEMILRLKGPDRVIAVSDAMPLAGLGAAAGSFCGQEVQTDGERATLADGTLAGSVTFLPEALARTASALQLSPSRLVSLGCTAAAQDLGLPRTGRIGSGGRADLVVWEDGRAQATLRGGEGELPPEWRIA